MESRLLNEPTSIHPHSLRLIDTAEYYGNEADVGAAVKTCGVPREDIFVVTKLWDHGYDTCMRHFTESFKKLDIGWVKQQMS